MKIFFHILVLFVLVTPNAVLAQNGLVPCSGPDCNTCSAIQLVNNVISFLITILSAIAVIIMVVAGFKMVTSGGNQTAWEDGKKMFGNVVIGIIIVLAAWLIVDTLLGMLTVGGGLEFWGSVSCSVAGSLSAASARNQNTVNQSQAVAGNGNLVSYSGAQFDSSIVDKVEYLDNNFALTVSGGHRTAARNAEVNGEPNSHHLTGRAADFVGSQSAMSEGAAWARANGAREVLIHNAGSGTHLHVAW